MKWCNSLKILGYNIFSTQLLLNHSYFFAFLMWLPAELEQIKLIFHKRFQKEPNSSDAKGIIPVLVAGTFIFTLQQSRWNNVYCCLLSGLHRIHLVWFIDAGCKSNWWWISKYYWMAPMIYFSYKSGLSVS